MNRTTKVVALTVLSVAQLTAAGWSIARYESTLKSGALYRVRTMVIDPADAFRGRYVAVRPTIHIAKPSESDTQELQRIQSGRTGYVVLGTDADGFASAARIVAEPPSQVDYLKVASAWQQWTRESAFAGYNIDFSFDRYYMNEAAAPEAQTRYFEAARQNSASRAWLAVRVKNGAGVIEGLFIDGVPIEKVVAAPTR
jgi:uncharacterized membrane-anchored protein